jgi:hypothetical protein
MTATSPTAIPTRRVTVLITCPPSARVEPTVNPLAPLIHNRWTGLFLPDTQS